MGGGGSGSSLITSTSSSATGGGGGGGGKSGDIHLGMLSAGLLGTGGGKLSGWQGGGAG